MSALGFIRRPLRELWNPPAGQLPALDALRSLAVLLVIFGHAAAEHVQLTGRTNRFANLPFVRGGFIGVDLFFVLSGYFIGRQLWREAQRTHTVAVGRFMVRRGFRIWPLYFFFLAFVLLVLGRGDFPYGKWWSDAVFLTNYVNQGVVMGSWSLCTEEQFYIVAPLAIFLSVRHVRGLASYRPWLVGLLVGLPVLRALLWLHYVGSLSVHDHEIFSKHIYYQFHTHADGLVMGLFIANLEVDTGDAKKRGLFSHGWVVGVALVVCVVLQRVQREVFDFTAVTLLFGSMVWYLLCRGQEGPRFLRLFDSKIFYVISRLSFGMYLNHEYLTMPLASALRVVLPFEAQLPALHGFLTSLIVALVSAAVSVVTFTAIEHPFLELRTRVLGDHKKPAAAPAV